jgi:hypothetical protein
MDAEIIRDGILVLENLDKELFEFNRTAPAC